MNRQKKNNPNPENSQYDLMQNLKTVPRWHGSPLGKAHNFAPGEYTFDSLPDLLVGSLFFFNTFSYNL